MKTENELKNQATADEFAEYLANENRLKAAEKITGDFEKELAELINKHNLEKPSNTPDFILAKYLTGCLIVWNENNLRRFDWFQKECDEEFPA